jgi:hypothetical protein
LLLPTAAYSTLADNLYTISGAPVRDMTPDGKQRYPDKATQTSGEESIGPIAADIAGMPFCGAITGA